MQKFRQTILICCFMLGACAQDPREAFERIIKDRNFIPFTDPSESTRVGTILNGNAHEIALIARPERCFPDLQDERALRWVDQITMPNEFKHANLSFNSNLNGVLTSGNTKIKFKSSATYVKTVDIELNGASIEYLDQLNFEDYYDSNMSSVCRRALSRYPFIAVALRIDSMKFIFRDEFGVAIDLKGRVSEIVDIESNVKWSIKNNYSLIIDTPKYIGYRMAKLVEQGEHLELVYASTTTSTGDWIFRSLESLENIDLLSVSKTGVRPAESLLEIP